MVVESPPYSPSKTARDWVEKRNRFYADRRTGVDRRSFYSIDYFIAGGQERRSGSDRRSGSERRRSWSQVRAPRVSQSNG